jgi:acyl-CoA hydrolase
MPPFYVRFSVSSRRCFSRHMAICAGSSLNPSITSRLRSIRIDFGASTYMGEIVELMGRVVRVGRRSLGVDIDMIAEALLTGERHRCNLGIFNMVAVGEGLEGGGGLPPLPASSEPIPDDGLHGGDGLSRNDQPLRQPLRRQCARRDGKGCVRRCHTPQPQIYGGRTSQARSTKVRWWSLPRGLQP